MFGGRGELLFGEKVFFGVNLEIMVAQVSILGRFIDFLSSQPTDEEILAVKASMEEEERFEFLSDLDNRGEATDEEEKEFYNAVLAEYIMGIGKANALSRMKASRN